MPQLCSKYVRSTFSEVKLSATTLNQHCLLFKLFYDAPVQLVAEIFNRSMVKFQYNWCIVVRKLTFWLCVSK